MSNDSSEKKRLTRAWPDNERQEAREVFDLVVVAPENKIKSSKKMRQALRALLGWDVSKQELQHIISQAIVVVPNEDNNGGEPNEGLDFSDFLNVVTEAQQQQHQRSATQETSSSGGIHEESKATDEKVTKAFQLLDHDGTGAITFEHLKRASDLLGENMTNEELQDMIDEADQDGDGKINPEEFLRIMKKTNLYS
mmetsp:Transcript_15206/g.27526  ORF Transcript_15206/g.27526 Transcript_15206/m.27526 type:complete len:196 (-) Transcript_15206:53-640(-)